MTSYKVLKTLPVAPGLTLELKKDTAEPEGSDKGYMSELVATGAEDADIFYVPPHWHKHHTERITVIEGRVQITVDGKVIMVNAGDATVLVPPRVVHSIRSFKGERLVIREEADPPGNYKVMFFNDVFTNGGFGNFLAVLRASYHGDAYMALPLYFRFFDEVFIAVFGGIAHLFTPAKPRTL